MAKKYEYHKRNDYPGERVAEKKRVAGRAKDANRRSDARVTERSRTEGLKADARVAKRGREDGRLMDSEVKRSANRAKRINRRRDAADTIGLAVIAGLLVVLVVGSVWGFTTLQKQSDVVDAQSDMIESLNLKLDKANADNYQLSVANNKICGGIDTNPPIVRYITPLTSVYPLNNAMDVPVRVPITVMFSEDMDPLTINEDTFLVEQRTTPRAGSDAGQYRSLPIDGVIKYSDRKATFTSDERFYPNQIYGNVFTVTITNGVKDVAGNPLLNDYVWSITTGNDPFIRDGTTS